MYSPDDALPADLFWDAWHCHDESAFPRARDEFDAAVIRRVGRTPRTVALHNS
ncbi:hypothetical protein [Streptomyces sp. NPDC094149]|uniref:hypothetical protein n=1 Tax=Streptomyces sp. NPDC094149 TaxID=3155079 RepID=UPI00332B90C2